MMHITLYFYFILLYHQYAVNKSSFILIFITILADRRPTNGHAYAAVLCPSVV